MRKRFLLVIGLILCGCATQHKPQEAITEATPIEPHSVRVAFVGDQGLAEESRSVLKLIKSEHSDLLVIPGDFDYQDDPQAWSQMLDQTIGDMPVFATIGNHDLDRWKDYQQVLKKRLEKISNADCRGEVGVKSQCLYRGIQFVLSGVGTLGENHSDFIKTSLNASNAAFKICVWHKNQRLMQVGEKSDEVGWEPYELCREAGAMVITAHEHSYARTYLMQSFQEQKIADKNTTLELASGKSFAVVTGLGGKSIRSENRSTWWDRLRKLFGGNSIKPADGDWWAKIYTADQAANYGALFCDFKVDHQPRAAHCFFKNIDGQIIDDFLVTSR